MEKRMASVFCLIFVGVMVISLLGCATGPTATASGTTMPQMLQEAGFTRYPAGTDPERSYLQVCPSSTLMIQEKGTAKCYAFADPATNSMYIGDEAAYRRLQELLNKQDQSIQEQKIQDDPQFWPMWGDRQGAG